MGRRGKNKGRWEQCTSPGSSSVHCAASPHQPSAHTDTSTPVMASASSMVAEEEDSGAVPREGIYERLPEPSRRNGDDPGNIDKWRAYRRQLSQELFAGPDVPVMLDKLAVGKEVCFRTPKYAGDIVAWGDNKTMLEVSRLVSGRVIELRCIRSQRYPPRFYVVIDEGDRTPIASAPGFTVVAIDNMSLVEEEGSESDVAEQAAGSSCLRQEGSSPAQM